MKRTINFLGISMMLCCASVKVPESPARTNDTSSFYKAYKDYFPIGAAINPDVDLVSEKRRNFIKTQYNSITPENQMKLRFIHPQKDKWNWEPADNIVRFASENNIKVRGHALIWQQNVPHWFVSDAGALVTKETLYSNMKSHIEGLMNRYKKNVYCWDVVNEAISDNPKEIFRSKDTLFAIAGEEYVEMAFRYARQADPDAQLFYNDYRFSDPLKRKKIYDLLKRLKEKGVPVDGIGLQSHYVPDEITGEYLQETIDMFAELGLKVQVTELDVSVYNYRDKKSPDADIKDDKYTPERMKKQESFYKMLFEIYRKNKDKITGVTFWGTSDMRKNYRTIRIGKMDYPFLFDENMRPKPAFYTIISF